MLKKVNILHWSLNARGCCWSVMVCVAFSYDHNLQLKVVNGTLNSKKYRDEILESDVRPSLNSPEGRKMMLPWPSLSPHLNPIEHLWNKLGRHVRNREPAVSNLRELRKALLEEWGRMHRLKRMKLVTSMIKRCQVVFRQRGGYTQFNRK